MFGHPRPSRPDTQRSSAMPMPPEYACRAGRHALWDDLSFEPWELVRLKKDVSKDFRAGDIVLLSDELVPYDPPIQLKQQGAPTLEIVTPVKFYGWLERTTYFKVTSSKNVGCTIPDSQLVDLKTNQTRKGLRFWHPKDLVKVRLNNDGKYKTVQRTITPESGGSPFIIEELTIKSGLVGKVTNVLTNTGVAVDPDIPSLRHDQCYIMEFTAARKGHAWELYGYPLAFDSFEKLLEPDRIAEKSRIKTINSKGFKAELVSFKDVPEHTVV